MPPGLRPQAARLPPPRGGDSKKDEGAQKSVSITISPWHLILPPLISGNGVQMSPFGEVTTEFKILDTISAAVIAGYGHAKIDPTPNFNPDDEVDLNMIEGGAQFRGYPIGNFDQGMQLGAEFMYLHGFGDDESERELQLLGRGLSLGAFIGYKGISGPGITFDGQIGVQWMAVSAGAKKGGAESDESDTSIGLLLNLNIGYSF